MARFTHCWEPCAEVELDGVVNLAQIHMEAHRGPCKEDSRLLRGPLHFHVHLEEHSASCGVVEFICPSDESTGEAYSNGGGGRKLIICKKRSSCNMGVPWSLNIIHTSYVLLLKIFVIHTTLGLLK